MAERIYFDNNATTKPLDEVVEAMLPLLRDEYANPSSVHQFGQIIRHRLECAREQVAGLLHANPKEIVFTSGGTEAINLAIRSALATAPTKRRIVTSAVEHSAVRRLGEQLEREGVEVVTIGVDQNGQLDLDELTAALTDDTAVVSMLHANNETGVLFDVQRIAELVAERGIPLHLDAVQAVGKVPIDVTTLPVQVLSLSGHKFHGPKGAGALFVRRRTRMQPLLVGGQQERGLRGGTENAAGIVGLGVAADLAARRTPEESEHVANLRDRLEAGICGAIPIAQINGRSAPRVGSTTNIGFRDLQAEAILMLLSEAGVCASAGAACSSGSLEPSHVLAAMNVDPRYAHGAIRFSLSSFNTETEVDRVVALIPTLIEKLGRLAASR